MKDYTITVLSENHASVLERLTTTLNYRHVRINSLKKEQNQEQDLSCYTLSVSTENENMTNVLRQIEKNVHILKASIKE